MKKVATSSLLKMKQENTKITALTAYDASFAKLFDEQGIDVLLIGDSLGMVLKGDDDTLSVTLEEIAYHTCSVKKGVERAFVVADMPFMSYSTPEQTYLSAAHLMRAGASMVKVEGGSWLLDTIKGLNERSVPVLTSGTMITRRIRLLRSFMRHAKRCPSSLQATAPG